MIPFAMTGVAGYIAPKHLRAIAENGGKVVAACDPHDAVGILDQFGFDVRFFTEFERFDRHLEKLRRSTPGQKVEYVTICSPNYMHDAHCRLALRIGAHAICEKPLVISPWNLDPLAELESESGRRIYTILQLRLHPAVRALREAVLARPKHVHDVCLSYVTPRGAWYDASWKGTLEKSGGVMTNIGIHFFDLLLWLFGPADDCLVHVAESRRAAGYLSLERARVRWFLSTRVEDLALFDGSGTKKTQRSMTVDGQELDLSAGFTDLHTLSYREILAGRGFGVDDARPGIGLAHRLRMTRVAPTTGPQHPVLAGRTPLA